jgi:Suppressor of fused protein (SUFU)
VAAPLPLPAHIERFLGRIEVGWTKAPHGAALPFAVLRAEPPALGGLTVFSTLGLSNFPMMSPQRRSIRHEFVVACDSHFRETNIPAVMQQLGIQVLDANEPVLRGDFIGPRGALFGQQLITGFYAAVPTFLPDDFGTGPIGDGTAAVFVWLIPVTTAEIEWGRQHGWVEFESRLEELSPDLFDLARRSIM